MPHRCADGGLRRSASRTRWACRAYRRCPSRLPAHRRGGRDLRSACRGRDASTLLLRARAPRCAPGSSRSAPRRRARRVRSGSRPLSRRAERRDASPQYNRRASMPARNIVVVGAGPVGTVAALACARFGHNVTLLEAQARVDDAPRASTTQPPTLEILAELGLIDEYIAQGLVARTFQCWDRATLKLIAEFDFDRLRDVTAYPYIVQTEQHKLALMGIERLRAMSNASVRMAGRVTGL